MEAEKRIEMDGVTYIMRPANADIGSRAAFSLLGIMKDLKVGITKGEEGGSTTEIDFGSILANLGSSQLDKAKALIYEHTNVLMEDGKAFKLSKEFNTHFNSYRGHMVPLWIEGFKYQFVPFLPSGVLNLSQIIEKTKASLGLET